MLNKKIQVIISIIVSIVIAVFLIAVTIHLIARFELNMLPKLIIPILVVFFPTWCFVYYGMFKKNKKK